MRGRELSKIDMGKCRIYYFSCVKTAESSEITERKFSGSTKIYQESKPIIIYGVKKIHATAKSEQFIQKNTECQSTLLWRNYNNQRISDNKSHPDWKVCQEPRNGSLSEISKCTWQELNKLMNFDYSCISKS